MILNKTYYQAIWDKYKNIPVLCALQDNLSSLTLKIVLEQCRNRKSIHFNFHNNQRTLSEIGKQLFVELANDIFCNAADFPPFNDGDIVRSKVPIGVGKPRQRNLDFIVKKLYDGKFRLYNEQFEIEIIESFDRLVKKFIPLTQRAHNETLKNFTTYFENLNGKIIHGFTPTYFERKSVFVAHKIFYDSLEAKNKIPTIYFSNISDGNTIQEAKSIPALPDSMIYFAPKYKVCYEKILLAGKKINTLVLFDTEEGEIEQIIQDKNRFGFNLIALTNTPELKKSNQVPCWNWFREETEIINSL